MMYQCGRCGLTRASGQEIGVIQKCKCPWEFVPPVSPQRTWVGLTPQERDEINEQVYGAVPHHVAFHAAIEQALREKNT